MTTNQCLAIIEAIAAVGRMVYFVGTKSPLLPPQKMLDDYNEAFEIIRNRLKTENERMCDGSKGTKETILPKQEE